MAWASPGRSAWLAPLEPKRYNWRRLNFSQRLAAFDLDPSSRLNGTVTDGGDGVGWTIPLDGGWGSTDWTGAWPTWFFDLRDVENVLLTGEHQIALTFLIVARGGLVAADEASFGIALVSETTTASATVDGMGVAITGTGAAGLGASRLSALNGTGAMVNAVGAATVMAGLGTIAYQGTGAIGRFSHTGTAGLSSTGAAVASGGATTVATVTPGASPTNYYLAVCAGRLSAGVAGAIAPTLDFYVAPHINPRMALT